MFIKGIIKKWILPPGILGLISSRGKKTVDEKKITIPASTLNSDRYENTLGRFKDKYFGKRCFILATGPSIQKQDLSRLKGQYCIAVSMFHLHEKIKDIKPIWHVLAPTHHPFKFDTSKIIFDSLALSYYADSDIKFLIGDVKYQYSYKTYLETQPNDFVHRFKGSINYLDYNESKVISESNFNKNEIWNLDGNQFSIRTVIYSAIQLAYHLGFTEIVLLGCDHDYLTDINRVENHHFYKEEKGFSDKEHLQAFDRERWFFEYYNRWKDYRLMKTFFESKNIKIINATEGGMLDVFERKSLTQIFNS